MLDAVLLLGPTACGKSALALTLAGELPLEIVSIDSAQVYRGMNIGTAKPTAAERAAVPHHLLDLREPTEPYSAADFVRDATAAIADIRSRGRLPLVVGGTMLYAKALREGLSDLPRADPAVRARLEAQARTEGWPALHARLAALDPASAARIAPNDRQRIQRALEVWEATGTPLSQLRNGARRPALNLATVALRPTDRTQLRQRIETRFDAMVAAGFLDEVRALMARGDLDPDLPALRSVGYRQAWEHLRRDTPVAEFRTAALHATRGLAKRQLTWLRATTDTVVFDPFAADTPAALRQALAAAQG